MSEKDEERYRNALHAVQSGVEMEHQLGSSDGSPKHLRVGVNSSLVNSSALGALLIKKGIITADEYVAAMADGMEDEAKRYEALLSERLGKKITLA